MSTLVIGTDDSKIIVNFEVENHEEKKKFRGILRISMYTTGKVLDTIVGKEWPTLAECENDIEKTIDFLKAEMNLVAIH